MSVEDLADQRRAFDSHTVATPERINEQDSKAGQPETELVAEMHNDPQPQTAASLTAVPALSQSGSEGRVDDMSRHDQGYHSVPMEATGGGINHQGLGRICLSVNPAVNCHVSLLHFKFNFGVLG